MADVISSERVDEPTIDPSEYDLIVLGTGKAVQVAISLIPCVESAWFQLLESTVLSSHWFQYIRYQPAPLHAGLAESMLAGAAAKEGKSVLHLDAAEGYGGAWGVLNLDSSTSGTSHGWNLPTGSPDPARGAQGTTADGTANGKAVEVEQTLNLC